MCAHARVDCKLFSKAEHTHLINRIQRTIYTQTHTHIIFILYNPKITDLGFSEPFHLIFIERIPFEILKNNRKYRESPEIDGEREKESRLVEWSYKKERIV